MPIHDHDYFTVTTSGYRYNPYRDCFTVTTSGYRYNPWLISTAVDISYWPEEVANYSRNDVIATEILEEAFKKKNEKEKKEMANVKMCDLCEAVYSTKKADKTWDDTQEDYGVYIQVKDAKRCEPIEICPDCYKSITDKLVELGLKAIEKDDKKEDD